MKGNYESITTLAQEIERQDVVRNDYIVPPEKWRMLDTGDALQIQHPDDYENLELTEYADGQLATKLGIPTRFYEGKLKEVPGLKSHTVNVLSRHSGKSRMIRTLDGKARAVLSDRFKPIDNYMIMQALLPVIKEHQDLQLKSLTLTDSRMYIQAVFPKVQGEVALNDVVQAGVCIRNSEVGAGAYEIESMLWRLRCRNGMIGQSLIRKYHTGRRIGGDENDYSIFHDDTMNAELEAYRLRTRDILAEAISEAGLQENIRAIKKAAGDMIVNPIKTVENVTKRFGIPEKHHDFMITNMGEDAGFNRWGLANSITALAKDIENKDTAYHYEKIGSEIIQLKPSEWEILVA